jgi:hypothetical protein
VEAGSRNEHSQGEWPEGRLAGASRKPNVGRRVLLGFAAHNPTYDMAQVLQLQTIVLKNPWGFPLRNHRKRKQANKGMGHA